MMKTGAFADQVHRLACFLACFAVTLLGLATDANACSCEGLDDPAAFVRGGDIIFTGRVIGVESIWPTPYESESEDRWLRTRFEVETNWKGAAEAGAAIDTYESSAACGFSFRFGESYTVVAYGSPRAGFTTGYCSMMPLISADERRQIQPLLDAYRLGIAEFDRTLADNPADLDALRGKARLLLSHDDWRLLAETSTSLLALRPGDEEAIAGRARALAALDLYEQGLQDFESILARRPDDMEAMRNRTIALFMLGRTSEIDRDTTLLRQRSYADINLAGRSLVGLDLTFSRLSRINLSGADLTGANLHGVRFGPETYIRDARFIGTNLQGIQASELDFTSATFRYVNLSGAVLNRARLNGMDLSTVALRRAELSRTSFRNANLSYADLTQSTGTEADFFEADLGAADLSKSQLRRADFRAAKLHTADLTYAALHEADLRGTDLGSADLRGADLSFARYDCRTRWPTRFDPSTLGAIPVERQCAGAALPLPSFAGTEWFYQPHLTGLDLSHLSFAGAQLLAADFRGSILRGADFSGTSLPQAKFGADDSARAADLGGANLRGAVLERADLRGANLVGANLADVRLPVALYDCKTTWPENFDPSAKGAVPVERVCNGRPVAPPDLSGARVEMASLAKLDLSGALFVDANLFRPDFSGANLRDADFSRAELSMASFSRADLTGANFAGARLGSSDFRNADLTGANLAKAGLGRADLRGATLANATLDGATFDETLYDGTTEFPVGFDQSVRGLTLKE